MRWLPAGIALLLAGVCLAADTPPAAAPSLCSNSAGAPACHGPAKDLKAARQAFARGLKLEKSQNLDEAFYEFEEASRLVPQNVEYLTAREMTRQHLAGLHLERGNNNLLNGRQVEALAEFRTALNLDPQNEFAQQRISDALGPVPVHTAGPPQLVAIADAIAAKPIAEHHDIHYRGDSRGLLTAVAASYGLTVVFDDNFPSRRVRFDMENADFPTAMHAASAVTKSFSVALEDTVLLASVDNPENHRLYDRMGMRSFYIPGGSPAQELNELMNSLRTLFEFKFASLNAASSTITLRGPQATLEAATQFLGQLNSPRPEVMLDLKVFQVSHTYARNIGLHVPNQFHLFNIPVAALTALGGQNIQDLINQLIASGGINQAGNQTIAALLAQLQGQQNSIFSQPLATFGGGLTLMGLSLDQLAGVLSMNESSVRSLDHVHLRASQGKDATFKLGSRYPILNASFAPIFNNAAISKVIGNQSFTAPFPSVNYEDIGLTLKAKPLVHGNSDVALELEIQFRTLGTTSANGVPVISNREYKGGILLKEGEPAVVAGMITASDQKSLSGLPAFSRIPGLGVLTSQSSKQEEDDELLILITPYVVRGPERTEAPEIWIGK
ncbi:MAG TPA: type II and III secretion system protein [Terriglobales bacterium]|nr:type II and III secretion system protein [Terriglobales bacterium]